MFLAHTSPYFSIPVKFLVTGLDSPTLALVKTCQLEHLAFYLVELCLVEYEALKFKPPLLCASIIYVAMYTTKDCMNSPARKSCTL